VRTPTVMPTLSPMSPTQVAQATNTSRRTVMRAIEAQELQAFRDNRNHWKITPQAVEEWAFAQHSPSAHAQAMPTIELPSAQSVPTPTEVIGALETERQARRLAEVEAAELRGKLAATEAERDRLHAIIQSLTAPQAKRRRWWLF
jgi:excisionase family DNA binding protein